MEDKLNNISSNDFKNQKYLKYNEFSDIVFCLLNPTLEEQKEALFIMNSLHLNFKLVFVNTDSQIDFDSKLNNSIYFIKLNENLNKEKKALRFCYNNFFSNSYFLANTGDVLIDFKLFFLITTKTDNDFILISEKARYYDEIFNKMFKKENKNKRFTPGSSYCFFSRKFLKLMLSYEYKNDIITESCIKCLYHNEINSMSLDVKGSYSKTSQIRIKNIKKKNSKTINMIFSLLVSIIPLVVYIIMSKCYNSGFRLILNNDIRSYNNIAVMLSICLFVITYIFSCYFKKIYNNIKNR